jgi:hypothetical protein
MAVSFEQLLEKKFGAAPPGLSRQEQEDDERRKALLAWEERASVPLEPTVPEPTFAQKAAQQIETAGRFTEEAIPYIAQGAAAVGETALQLGSGLIGGGVGLVNFIEGTIRKAGQELPTRKYIEDMVAGTGPPSDPHYWKNLTAQTHKLASDFTYTPRTPGGQRLSAAVNYPLQALHYMSQGASQQALSRMLFTEDQRHAVAYAHELVTMGTLGEIGMGVLGRVRSKRFQDEFSTAAREVFGTPGAPDTAQPVALLPKNAESLLATAEQIIHAAESRPEIVNKLELVQGINPRLMPSLRERGRALIERLKENPDNPQHITQAVSFFESTRRVQDDITQGLRRQIGEYVEIGDIRDIARADRVARLRELQQHPQALEALDRWMVDKELAEIAESEATVGRVVEMIQSSDAPLSINAVRREFGIGHERASQLVAQAREALERPLPDTPPAARRQEPLAPAALVQEEVPLVTDTPALRMTRAQRDRLRQAQEEPLVAASGEAATSGLNELASKGPEQVSVDTKISAAQEMSRIFTDKAETLKRLQDSIETGRDISRDISREIPGAVDADFAVMKYQKAMEIGRKGLSDSSTRRINEMLSDILELFAFDIDPSGLGSNLANISLSHRQKMAAQRLLADAKKGGRDLNELINETISDPDLRMTYRAYLGSISDAVAPPLSIPKNMPMSGSAANDPPIQRRVVNGLDKLPVYLSEAQAVQNAAPGTTILPSSLETPIHTMRRFSPELKAMTVDAYHKIKTDIHRETKIMRDDLQALKTMAGYTSRKNISQYAFGEGKALSQKETQVLTTLEVGIGATLDRINAQRRAIGLDEIPSTTQSFRGQQAELFPQIEPMRNFDPLSFARTVTAKRAEGAPINLVTAHLSDIMDVVGTHGIQYPKTLTQRMLRRSGERDIFEIYSDFTSSAIDQIRTAPLTEKMKELYSTSLPDVNSPGNKWSMDEKNPQLYHVLKEWTETLEGKSNFPLGKSLGVDWDQAVNAMRENITFSTLAYSWQTLSAQPFAMVNTLNRVGPKHFAGAVKDVLESAKLHAQGKPHPYERALSTSEVLSGRADISVYADWIEAFTGADMRSLFQHVREGRVQDVKRGMARIGMVPMQALDMTSAVITYLATERQGYAQGLRGRDLVHFADDAVIETQGSSWRGDLSPIQRNALGKSLTQFQTFAISDYNNIVHNVLKIGKGSSPKAIAKSVGLFATTVAAANMATDAFNLFSPLKVSSPLPRPYKAFQESRNRDDDAFTTALNVFFQTVAPYAPMVGGSRYGKGIGGPVIAELFVDIPNALQGKPGASSIYESLSQLGGVPGGNVLWRVNKESDQRNILDRITNWRGEDEAPGASSSRGIGRGGMRSRLRGIR